MKNIIYQALLFPVLYYLACGNGPSDSGSVTDYLARNVGPNVIVTERVRTRDLSRVLRTSETRIPLANIPGGHINRDIGKNTASDRNKLRGAPSTTIATKDGFSDFGGIGSDGTFIGAFLRLSEIREPSQGTSMVSP